MCGKTVTPMENLCPGCGEPIPKANVPDVARDRMLCYLVGGFTGLMTGGMLINCVMLHFQVLRESSQGHSVTIHLGTLDRDIMMIFTFIASVWLWGPPLLRVAIHDPKSYGKAKIPSRWRLFWQTQVAMYALSVAFVLLCLVTCATR